METWPRPEDADGRLPGREVVLAALGVLARGHPREHLPVPHLEVQPERLDAAVLQLGEPREVVGRLDLHLHGQARSTRGWPRRSAPCRAPRGRARFGVPVVRVTSFAPSRRAAASATSASSSGVLVGIGAAVGQAGADGAEVALLVGCPSRRSAGRPSRPGCPGASGRSSSREPRRPSRGRRSSGAGAAAPAPPRRRRAAASRRGPSRSAPARTGERGDVVAVDRARSGARRRSR